ncbi:MAG TPA: SufD family Fe-S cluster assembly protein [Nitrospiraceae bacterium]|nr:SufD family Fe-S cluster assembly protein [Nitrospiraceae bacterium]
MGQDQGSHQDQNNLEHASSFHANSARNADASAIPIVRVFHPEAKVTHEAAIGSVDKKELETLMARGLSPEQAVEMIMSGILR